MNNVLIVPSTPATEWVKKALPGTSAAELPVAGKRVIDYILQRVQKRDVVFTEVLDWGYSKALATAFSDLAVTGRPVFYLKGEGPEPKGLKDLEGMSTPLTQNMEDGLVVVWGLCLEASFQIPDARFQPSRETEPDLENTEPGVYRREGGRWVRLDIGVRVIDSVAAWHWANFAVLHSPGDFTLPGYSVERGVHLGRNVVMEKGTDVKAPALLQDNTWLAQGVVLEGDVIVGAGSFVSEGARLKNTVVCGNTYLGEGLELEGKIVSGSRIFDAATGTWTDVDDRGVASPVLERRSLKVYLKRAVRFLLGYSRGRRD